MFRLVSKKRLDVLQKEYNELKLRIDRCREIEAKNIILNDRIYQLEVELRTAKEKIREQIEADLFFVSAKIQKKLLDGEPKENVQDLRLQQLAYQAQAQQQSCMGNPL